MAVAKSISEQSAALHEELVGATRSLSRILTVSHKMRANRQQGCERCVEWTESLIDILMETYRSVDGGARQKWNSDSLVVGLEQFTLFPRSFRKVIRMCALMSTGNERNANVFLTQLVLLCELAVQYLEKQDYLPFARIVHTLHLESVTIQESLTVANLSERFKEALRPLLQAAVALEVDLQHHDAFQTLFCEDRGHSGNIRGKKRIEGGGLLDGRRAGSKAKWAPNVRGWIIDCCVNAMLAVVTERLDNVYEITCRPVPREVDFEAKVYPIKTRRFEHDSMCHEVQNEDMRKYGRYYQVLQIESISPHYYYLAMCAGYSSKIRYLADRRMIDRFDWESTVSAHQLVPID